MHEQCVNSVFCPNSCDITIHALKKKKKKSENVNVGLETRIQTHIYNQNLGSEKSKFQLIQLVKFLQVE